MKALVQVTDDIRQILDYGKIYVLVFIDISKAFDTVDYSTNSGYVSGLIYLPRR